MMVAIDRDVRCGYEWDTLGLYFSLDLPTNKVRFLFNDWAGRIGDELRGKEVVYNLCTREFAVKEAIPSGIGKMEWVRSLSDRRFNFFDERKPLADCYKDMQEYLDGKRSYILFLGDFNDSMRRAYDHFVGGSRRMVVRVNSPLPIPDRWVGAVGEDSIHMLQ